MSTDVPHRLIAALADPQARKQLVSELAAHLGVAAVYVLMPHPDAPAKLIPAPGFVATIPASRGWRELFAACMTPGVHHATVAFPRADADAPVIAYAHVGVTIALVGATAPDPSFVAAFAMHAPLLGALLHAEGEAALARADLETARQAAERAVTLARALDLARSEAERATRVKDEFLAMLGHELRNPLAPIVTALEMLRMEGVSSRASDVLERQVAHVMRLVDDLLDVSRITGGKIELRRDILDIGQVITRAVEMARPILEQRRTELVLDIPEDGLVVDGDPSRLAQVVSNLLTNAAKYSDPRTQIRVHGERVGANVRVTVQDQGIGIDPAYLDRVFDNFVQVPQGIDRSSGGLGLGLAIVRNLVALHGGTVRVVSEGRGCGSSFIVELPAVEGPVRRQTEKFPALHPTASAARILVVDDNTDAADLLSEVLSARGHSVQVANSGPEALGQLATFTPDVALLDIGLPVMDGFELAQHLRVQLPSLRLVAITGYGQANDRAKTRSAGFDVHLTKPVSLSSLTETLAALLPR